MGLITDAVTTTGYLRAPNLTTAQIDAAILANEIPQGSLLFDTVENIAKVFNGTGITPVVFSPVLTHEVIATAAQILACNVTPIVLVPAQGVNKVLQYISASAFLDFGTVAFNFSASGFKVVTQGDTQQQDGSGAGITYLGGATVDTIGLSAAASMNGVGLPFADMQNKSLDLLGFAGPSTGGTGCTVKFTTVYNVLDYN